MEVAKLFNGLRPNERYVAGEHQHMGEVLHRAAGLHHGVPGAELLGLKDEVYAGRTQCSLHPVGLMPDDHEDILRRDDAHGGGYNVRQ